MRGTTPPPRRVSPSGSALSMMIAVVLAATCGTARDVMCPSAVAESPEDPEYGDCLPEPAGQACDKETQRCESICDSSEYLLRCQTAAQSVSAAPITGKTPRCGPLRAPVDVPPDETLYCCKCEG